MGEDAKHGEEQTTERRRIKVRVPVETHIRLHAHKVLTGEPISDVVTVALSHYFEELSENPELERILEDVAIDIDSWDG